MTAASVSAKPSKQRKRLLNAPWHRAIKMMATPLSKELRTKFGVRSLPVRVGDTVKVFGGGYKKRSGKVSRVDTKKMLVFIEGITGKAQKGRTKMVGIHVSNLTITKLDLSDKRRRAILERKGAAAESVEKEFEAQEEEQAAAETPAPEPAPSEGGEAAPQPEAASTQTAEAQQEAPVREEVEEKKEGDQSGQ
ncbi:MAG: 50S ribosomal protein L24 [Thermoprotei archaeon]